jgi:hypothetical protein
MTRNFLVAAVLALFLTSAWAETVTLHARVTSLEEADLYQIKPDPNLYGSRPAFVVRTEACRHQATDEAATITGDKASDRAWLVFTSGDSCEILRIGANRDELAQ